MNRNIEHHKDQGYKGDTRVKISMSQGISGWFDVDGLIISFWASSWTGREIVRVEDEEGARIVSNRRSFKFTTPHEFTVGSDQYRLEAQINFARVELRLFRNAALVDSDQFNPSKKRIRIDPETGKVDWTYILKKTVVPILFGLTVGVVFGFTAGSVVKWWLA